MGILTYRSRFLPRFLGVRLVLNGFTYLVLSFTGFVFPQYEDRISSIAFPILTGELAFTLWHLIKGAKPPAIDTAASSSARD